MEQIKFFDSFVFNIYKFYKYRLTDYSKTPVPFHYFGRLIKGTAKIKTQDDELELKVGEIFYIPKGLKYQSFWYGDTNNEIEFYSFGFTFSPKEIPLSLQKISPNSYAYKLFDELCQEIPCTEKGIGLLYHFFGEVVDNMQPSKRPHSNATIEKAIQQMRDRPNMRIDEIARLCNISESGIYTLFKKHLNQTPNEVRNRILCEKAVLLLTTTTLSVEEISDTLCFSSTSYFRKILKAHTGKTPLAIRRKSAF